MSSQAYTGSSKRRGVLALALLLPAPTIGVAFGMIWFPDTSVGTAVFAATKLWVFALPAVWLMVVDKEPPSWSRPKAGGFGVAALLGVVMSAVIVLVYAVLPDETLNAERLQTAVVAVGLDSPEKYLAGAAYWNRAGEIGRGAGGEENEDDRDANGRHARRKRTNDGAVRISPPPALR